MTSRKGIILAGGRGTRLDPATKVVCKQLLPVYDKPLIYYPLSVLMLSGIREILIISTPEDTPRLHELLGDGSDLGVVFEYVVQPRPEGIAQAFLLGSDFIGNSNVALILGDNIFFGHGLTELLQSAGAKETGATIFAYSVAEPQRYGVVEFDTQFNAISIQEKPRRPRSHYAVTGLYFYDSHVVEFARSTSPSQRGELEITDINRMYLEIGTLEVKIMGRGMAWLDTGTPQSLLDAANFIRTIETRQGVSIGCIEEVAYRMHFIDSSQLKRLVDGFGQNEYARGLGRLADNPSGSTS